MNGRVTPFAFVGLGSCYERLRYRHFSDGSSSRGRFGLTEAFVVSVFSVLPARQVFMGINGKRGAAYVSDVQRTAATVIER